MAAQPALPQGAARGLALSPPRRGAQQAAAHAGAEVDKQLPGGGGRQRREGGASVGLGQKPGSGVQPEFPSLPQAQAGHHTRRVLHQQPHKERPEALGLPQLPEPPQHKTSGSTNKVPQAEPSEQGTPVAQRRGSQKTAAERDLLLSLSPPHYVPPPPPHSRPPSPLHILASSPPRSPLPSPARSPWQEVRVSEVHRFMCEPLPLQASPAPPGSPSDVPQTPLPSPPPSPPPNKPSEAEPVSLAKPVAAPATATAAPAIVPAPSPQAAAPSLLPASAAAEADGAAAQPSAEAPSVAASPELATAPAAASAAAAPVAAPAAASVAAAPVAAPSPSPAGVARSAMVTQTTMRSSRKTQPGENGEEGFLRKVQFNAEDLPGAKLDPPAGQQPQLLSHLSDRLRRGGGFMAAAGAEQHITLTPRVSVPGGVHINNVGVEALPLLNFHPLVQPTPPRRRSSKAWCVPAHQRTSPAPVGCHGAGGRSRDVDGRS